MMVLLTLIHRGREMIKPALFQAVLVVALFSLEAYPKGRKPQPDQPSGASESIKAFLGRWDLSIKAPKGELPSWIEVSEKQGHLRVVMVGITDHATELKKADLKDGEIEFLS